MDKEDIIEHSLYEIRMLAWSYRALQVHTEPSSLRNALIECFIIHFRCLYEFIFEKGKWDTDLTAKNIVQRELYSKWLQDRGEETSEFKILFMRANKEIAHLTQERVSDKRKDHKKWPFFAMYGFILEQIITLSKYAHKDYEDIFVDIKKAAE